jgi:hypothetical protein
MSTFLETSNVFVRKVLEFDNEMKAQVSEEDINVDDIYQMYLDRLSLYEKSSLLPLNENDNLFLQHKKEDVYLEFNLFKYKQDMQRQLADIQASLEELKNP